MSDYRFITDSTADLTPAMVSEADIDVIPMEFTVGDSTYMNYPDERELSTHEFYDSMRAGCVPTTAQINITRYIDIFSPILESGKDVLYLAFSSALSGTFNSSLIAAADLAEKYPDRKVVCIDSFAASLGEGLLAFLAGKKRLSGASIDELADWITDTRDHLCHWFTVDDLVYLKRGGRISAAVAAVGSMLSIKPVMHVDDTGHLVPVEKVRGRRASIVSLFSHMEKTVVDPDGQTVFIGHGDCVEDAETLASMIREKFPGITDIRLNYVGPTVGSHSGPGTIALFYLGSKK